MEDIKFVATFLKLLTLYNDTYFPPLSIINHHNPTKSLDFLAYLVHNRGDAGEIMDRVIYKNSIFSLNEYQYEKLVYVNIISDHEAAR